MITIYPTDKPWVTEKYKQLITQLQAYYRSRNIVQYHILRNSVNKESKSLRSRYYNQVTIYFLCCVKFKSLREKYIKPYYYRRTSMQKFVELMNTDNRRKLHRLMMFLKLVFKLYMDTLLE